MLVAHGDQCKLYDHIHAKIQVIANQVKQGGVTVIHVKAYVLKSLKNEFLHAQAVELEQKKTLLVKKN